MRRRRFHGGHVLIEGELVRADVVVDGEVIAEVVTDVMDDDRGAQTDVDCRERVISAGFIDLQCNGAGGVGHHHRTAIASSTSPPQLPRFGVTSFLPTVVTARSTPPERPPSPLCRRTDDDRRTIGRPPIGRTAPTPLGLHFEGPMISPPPPRRARSSLRRRARVDAGRDR
jgi:N-acetylglucosamine-6-phosphate deacetylase